AVHDESHGTVWVPFDLDEAFGTYVSETWRRYAPARGLSPPLLDLYYRIKPLIPRRAQISARRLLARRHRNPSFPKWPIEDGVLSLLNFYGFCLLTALDEQRLRFRWFWPNGHRATLILTHDVESSEGL